MHLPFPPPGRRQLPAPSRAAFTREPRVLTDDEIEALAVSAGALRPLPLERWAARSPRTRWPLVLLLIVLLIGLAGGLTACGGGDPEPEACPIEWVTLPDGRVVQAPNNCPPDCLNHPELCKP